MNKNTYNLSALATIVTTSLVVSHQANAAVIYFDTDLTTSWNRSLDLDINSDTFADIQFKSSYSSYYGYRSGSRYSDLYVNGVNGALISIGGPLSLGEIIDDSIDFGLSNHLADYNYRYWSGYRSCGRWSCYSRPGGRTTNTYGSWNDGLDSVSGYLGFSLLDNNDTLFGWAEVSMRATGQATIHGYAYETCADTGIAAGEQSSSSCSSNSTLQAATVPEPSPIALLALGSVGLFEMKRRRKKSLAV